jgi:hypothetical protein
MGMGYRRVWVWVKIHTRGHGCHDPDFFKNKNFIMHSWHIAFQDLFQSFELYSSKNIVKCPFSQVLDIKGFQKESVL